MKEIIIYGTRGHAKVVTDAVKDFKVVGYFDDASFERGFLGIKVFEYNAKLFKSTDLVIAIGDNLTRKRISENVKHSITSIAASSAEISKSVQYGEGCMILQGSVIQSGAVLGRHVIINTAASVDHDCRIDSFVHIAPNSTLCGKVSVGEGTLVGAGSTVLPGIKIGKWANIGAGSVVTKDVEDNTTVVGNPARRIK
jgi:sugar O-acyltransferase (sialic acid O-acetyltransferase NeuD family)